MKLIKYALWVFMLFGPLAYAEIAVIVHPSNIDALSQSEVSSIFLGKSRTFPNGKEAVPLQMSDGSSEVTHFNKNVIKKSSSQVKAYWSKMIFTGKGTPPKTVDTADEVIDLVSKNPNFVGFIDASQVTGSVKSVGTF